MPPFACALDPAAAIEGRTELPLNAGGIAIPAPTQIDWGEAAIKAFLAEQLFGEVPSDFRVPNRIVSIPLVLGSNASGSEAEEEEVRRKLEQKVGLLQRQGGVLLRKRSAVAEAQNEIFNPSFEYNALGVWPEAEGALRGWGWAGPAGATHEVSEGWAAPEGGKKSIKITTPSDTSARDFFPFRAGAIGVPVVAGQTYVWRCVVNVLKLPAKGAIYLQTNWREGPMSEEGAILGGGANSALITSLGVHVIEMTGTAPAKATKCIPLLEVENGTTAGVSELYADAFGWLPPAVLYGDGDTPGHYWTGTPGFSVSAAGGAPLYADIVNASLTVPDVYGEVGGIEPGVTLKLECLPDFYGEPIILDAIKAKGQIVSVLKQGGTNAVIGGDYPARTRLVVAEKSGDSQRGMFWGVRSTHYSEAASAGLFYDAYLMGLINGTVSKVLAGTFSGKAAYLETPVVNAWHPLLELESEGAALTHVGSFRVWARMQAGAAGTKVRLGWQPQGGSEQILNEEQEIPAAGEFFLVDLGEVRLEEPPVGSPIWTGVISAETGSASHFVAVDRVWLQPLDDGAGRLRATAVVTNALLAPSNEPETGATSNSLNAGKAWVNPANVTKGHTGQSASAGFLPPGFPAEATQALKLTKFGFAIPSGATIHGIEVAFTGGAQNSLSNTSTLTTAMLKAGVKGGTAKEVPTTNEHVHHVLGGSSDLWGTTWTPAQINEESFGLYVYITNALNGEAAPEMYWPFMVTVYFSFGTEGPSADAVLYANRTAEIRTEGAFREAITTASYTRVSEETGDLIRIPPSGLEGRPVQLLAKHSRGLLPGAQAPGQEQDASATDELEVQVIYQPCFLGRI